MDKQPTNNSQPMDVESAGPSKPKRVRVESHRSLPKQEFSLESSESTASESSEDTEPAGLSKPKRIRVESHRTLKKTIPFESSESTASDTSEELEYQRPERNIKEGQPESCNQQVIVGNVFDDESPYAFFKENDFQILYSKLGRIPHSAKFWITSNELIVFVKRPSTYKLERRVPGIHRATLKDLRGHLDFIAFHYVPSGAVLGERAKMAVNVLSNFAPGNNVLNDGAWKEMEKEDVKLAKQYDEVIVMVGNLLILQEASDGSGEFLETKRFTKDGVEIPNGFYRARACRKGDKWTLTYRSVRNTKPNPLWVLDDFLTDPLFIFRYSGQRVFFDLMPKTTSVNGVQFNMEEFNAKLESLVSSDSD
uniref:(northern house mosquito) hypothetical protein n=1 Tax=Culex pipiens TaxID=7175 RepID=A0A8D8CVM5_CULPI